MLVEAIKVRRNLFLPFELGVGYECLGQALFKISTIKSFNNPEEVWELMLLLSNAFEHIQKAIIEYTAPITLKRNSDPEGPEIIILKASANNHKLLNHNRILEEVFGFKLTSEQKAFLDLLATFQKPVHRYENTNGNLAKDNLELMLVQFVKGVNHRRCSDKIIAETLIRNIQQIIYKYDFFTPQELNYTSMHGEETLGIYLQQAILQNDDLEFRFGSEFEEVAPRTEYSLETDIKIGIGLIRSGLMKLATMQNLIEQTEGWVFALLISNGMEKIISAARLYEYEYLSDEFLEKVRQFKSDTSHNMRNIHDEIEILLMGPPNGTCVNFISFVSDAINGYNRYENINFQKVEPDIDERLCSYVTYGLFEGRYEESLLIGSPEVVAYKLQEEIAMLLSYYQSLGINIPFEPVIEKPESKVYKTRKRA